MPGVAGQPLIRAGPGAPPAPITSLAEAAWTPVEPEPGDGWPWAPDTVPVGVRAASAGPGRYVLKAAWSTTATPSMKNPTATD